MRRHLDTRYDQPPSTECRNMKELGKVLRTRRKELGMKQSEVAEFCRCSQRLISEMERGRGTVGIDKVIGYANGLGIDFIATIRGK